jgi:ligand-binding SRPBCC domain-containing protein
MHYFTSEQNLSISLEEAWSFFSNPANLIVLTHPKMGMTMTSDNGLTPIFEGKVLKIGIKIFGIFPSSFLSEITEIKPLEYFIDTQLTGPFAYWQHKHLLIKTENGVTIVDQINLKFPLGLIGQFAYKLFGKRHLQNVFNYRKQVLVNRFG